MRNWLVLVAIMAVTTVSAWITAFFLRRRIRRALGKQVSDAELTSINLWMKVHDAEKDSVGKSEADHQATKRWLEPD